MKMEELSPVQRKFRLEITEDELRMIHFAIGKVAPDYSFVGQNIIHADRVYDQLDEFMVSVGLLRPLWRR